MTDEALKDMIKRRNKALEEFWISRNINIRLIGNEHNPAMILDDEVCLSAYVHNFELILTSKNKDGNEIARFRLNNSDPVTRDQLTGYLTKAEHRKVYKIRHYDLFLVGYNFLDLETKQNKYPVFALYRPKIYFSKEKVELIVDELYLKGYNNLQII